MKKSELIEIIKESILPDMRKLIREELEYIINKSAEIDESTKANKGQFKKILGSQKAQLDESFGSRKKLEREHRDSPDIIKNIVSKDYSKLFAKK